MLKTTPRPQPSTPASVADSGKIRVGAGWGLLPPVRK
jgi:hypothetical protein